MISGLKSGVREALQRLYDFYLVKRYPPPPWPVPLRDGLVSAYPPPKKVDLKVDLKYRPLEGFHYDDCPLGPGWSGCWCEHRNSTSHYGGGTKPGWHREFCPKTGLAWISLDKWYEQPKCECEKQHDLGIFILTFSDGKVHGPAPSPLPKEEDCVTISEDEVNAILDSVEKPDD